MAVAAVSLEAAWREVVSAANASLWVDFWIAGPPSEFWRFIPSTGVYFKWDVSGKKWVAGTPVHKNLVAVTARTRGGSV